MAEAFRAAGYTVCGYDPVTAAAQRLKRAGGEPLASATEVAERADILITSLASAAALDDAVSEICRSRKRRRLLIEMSTLPLADKRRARTRLARARVDRARLPGERHRRAPEGAHLDDIRERRSGGVHARQAGARGLCRQHSLRRRLRQRHADEIRRQPPGGDPQRGFRRSAAVRAAHGARRSPRAGRVRSQPGRRHRRDAPARRADGEAPLPAGDDEDRGLAEGHAHHRRHGACSGAPTPLFDACAPVFTAALGQGFGEADTASVYEVLDRRSLKSR